MPITLVSDGHQFHKLLISREGAATPGQNLHWDQW